MIQRAYARLIKDIGHGGIDAAYTSSKYCAMNANSLRGLGTFEFRHMAGTIDVAKISAWINIILQLKVAALLQEPLDKPDQVWGPFEKELDIRPEDFESGHSIINNLQLWR